MKLISGFLTISIFLPCVELKSFDWTLLQTDPEVFLPNLGQIQGTTRQSYFTQRPIYSFLGVNYAMPPSEKRRFQPPEPFQAWTGVYNATKFRQRCPQVNTAYYPELDPSMVNAKDDIEDCLVLNIFTPKLPKNNEDPLLPVLFYIHGGSFYAGSAYDFFPDFLLEEDVVLVVIQYRLGVLGYASLQTNDIPGNVGFLDIIEGLKWVQQNIIYFSGDPGKVTAAGQSAGASAVTALLISPLVNPDLFSQLIVMSGSALSTWSLMQNPVATTTAIAREAQCNSDDIKEIADCLRKSQVKTLLEAHMSYVENGTGLASGMVVQEAGTQKFLVEKPLSSFDRGNFLKVPLMIGGTRDEGTSFLANFYYALGNNQAYFNRNLTRDVLRFCGIDDQTGSIADYLQNKYFSNVDNLVDSCPSLVDLVGVLLIKGSTYNVARRMSVFQPTYMYSFNYKGNVSKFGASEPNWSQNYPFPTGVAHSDDLGYLFPMQNTTYSSEELQMVRSMTKLWTNFIIKGQPGPTDDVKQWNQVTTGLGPYLRIDKDFKQYDNVFKEYEVAQTEGFINESTSLKSKFLTFIAIVGNYLAIY